MLHHYTKAAVILTSFLLLIALSFILFFHPKNYPQAIPLYTEGQPTAGQALAKVHVVSFEDPYCNNCIIYHRHIFNQIDEEYIQKEKIKYTLYLVSSLPNSGSVNSLLFCINQQSTKACFDYLDLFYQNPPLALTQDELNSELFRIMKKNRLGVQESMVESCYKKGNFQKKVVDNTNYARAIMGGVIKTPTIFVNGIRVVDPTLKELKALIDQELKKGPRSD